MNAGLRFMEKTVLNDEVGCGLAFTIITTLNWVNPLNGMSVY